MAIEFEWDDNKDVENKKKHGITFSEASSVFYDEQAVLIDDPGHSSEEERFLMLGMSFHLRILVVCHCVRQKGDVIRIISARKATKNEREQYERRWRS